MSEPGNTDGRLEKHVTRAEFDEVKELVRENREAIRVIDERLCDMNTEFTNQFNDINTQLHSILTILNNGHNPDA
ncbi:MAG: hypothetical protein OXG49_09365 [Chloroflexi bacterium]|nr:hypothetical protein [Chloroflexota bacterium]